MDKKGNCGFMTVWHKFLTRRSLRGMRFSTLPLKALFVVCFSIHCLPSCTAETTEKVLSYCRPVTQAKVVENGAVLNQDFESGYCWGAFATVAQMLMTVDSGTRVPIFHVCLPENHTRSQLIAVFVQ